MQNTNEKPKKCQDLMRKIMDLIIAFGILCPRKRKKKQPQKVENDKKCIEKSEPAKI